MSENIETLQRSTRVIPPPPDIQANAHIQDYDTAYKQSIADPEKFWDGIAKELHWFSPWTKVLDWNYPWAKWFVGGTCNIAYNCLDRHVQTWRKNKVAVIWVGEEGQERILTYGELYRQVNKCANALKSLGLNKGDRVTIYLPKIPEQIVAMLACARIGVIHSVVYSGFSATALAARIEACEARVVITADVGYDRSKKIPLKPVVDEAVAKCPTVEKVIVVQREPSATPLQAPKEIDWEDWLKDQSPKCEAEQLDSETPLIHPLYLRDHGKTQRRGPCPRWLHGGHLHYHQICL